MLATRARMAAGGADTNAIVGTLVGPTTIATSTSSTATAYSNQRKVDRCQNGVLWSMFWDGTSTTTTSMDFYYSTDDGATWTKGGEFGFAGTGTTYTPNASLFIDLDDYAHVVYKDRHDGYIYYRRGTPNAGRTAWTWSAASQVSNQPNHGYPDVVVHREGTGWAVHVMYSENDAWALYRRIDISSGGTITVNAQVNGGGVGAAGTESWPSIDFNHTGDGKTVAGGTPHLYVAWSAGGTGSGKGIRFKKATYSGGTWTWGTEREIDSTRFIEFDTRWLSCLFDGTRVIIAGHLDSGPDLVLYERDAADTTTTTRVLVENVTSSTCAYAGSATYDGDGNVYLFGRYNPSGGSPLLGYRVWDRTTAILGTMVEVDADTASSPWVSAKRGYSSGRIEFIYTDGTASPFNVNYGAID